ncbi:N-lysine methyltransferase [Thalictrum thalictroides]|uniref:N-lysine methyltransferase n=1 Tax=Thalictrum thalictroides TaxID=46969 RepID=A0A7J6UVE3_THATH|nr:N-lysine methyltransferase [Thalictrum thalictroides]
MKNVGGFPENEIQYDSSSRIDPKRPHHWFLDASERELSSSKKSAVEDSNGRPISGVSNVNLSWETPSSFQSSGGHLTDRLFGLDIPRTIDFGGRNFQPVNAGNLDIGRRGIEDQYGNDASIALSMSHTMEEPGLCLTYGGIRKVKVNQVRDSDNGMSMQMGETPSRCDFSSTVFNTFQEALPANQVKGSENGMSMLMGNSISFNRFQEAPEINQFRDSDSGVPMKLSNTFSNSISYNGFQEAPHTSPQPCSPNQVKDSGNGMMIQLSNSFNRFDNNTISFRGFQEEHEIEAHSGRLDQVKDNGNIMSVQLGDSFSKGDLTTISFGGVPVEPETSSYDLLRRQSSLQQSEGRIEKAVDKTATELVVSATPLSAVSGKNAKAKNELKVSKKMPPNSFPSNVRSLLNTGMLDGVPVKYVSWQHEKELIGIIQGTGYMCGCESCNYSKVINAYEFEKHAGTKTKHPNNHIYFDNGKTVYTIVQELKSTPHNMLFEAIQNCTGSVINQKAFNSWKVSFQAATRELERIYGKDLLKPSTQSEE